ncbi:hypothetical protein PVAND_010456 [Polypedilum vanderplanki]|uniref:Amine oxidase domain-containing protein n=1 Tax=Polypedilum vanderplanki TaxID=319348 RepID=A0A9J6CHB0_POLVA|nr:hypothetical protein PVAND_010456 [Polypedilum vanderplanki]
MLKSKENGCQRYDVIVLGCGIAGLGAGRVLKGAKVNFLMIEGSDRVGGRIHTVNMKNLQNNNEIVRVEAGAQWIHGKHNELYQYANQFKMIRTELSEEAEGDYIREDGVHFNAFFVRKIDFKIGQLLEECEKFVEHKSDKNFVFPTSIAEYVEEKFDDFLKTLETNEERTQARQLLDWHRKFQIIDNSCDYFNDISAKDWGNYSFNGESCQTHINVTNGMSAITDKLYEELKNFIRLNKAVKHVLWDAPEGIKIICEDESSYLAQNVICTFSLGVLKQHQMKMFSPPLLRKHKDVIESIGFGTINKIFLKFNERWWDKDWKGLQMLWNDDLDENSHWTKYMTGFDVAYPVPENTLIGWIGGKGAKLIEKITDEEIAEHCTDIIRKFLKDKNIPNPSHVFCSRWNTNKFIGGAYSYTSKNTDNIERWEKILSFPIIKETSNGHKNLLLFAGEAVHEQYFSTVHGAFLSGIQQAELILNFRKKCAKL